MKKRITWEEIILLPEVAEMKKLHADTVRDAYIIHIWEQMKMDNKSLSEIAKFLGISLSNLYYNLYRIGILKKKNNRKKA